MAEDDFLVSDEDSSRGEFVLSENSEMSLTESCDAYVQKLLGRWSTRPGPDEEFHVQIIATRRPRMPERGRLNIRRLDER